MGLITPEHPEAPEPTDAEVVADLHRDCVDVDTAWTWDDEAKAGYIQLRPSTRNLYQRQLATSVIADYDKDTHELIGVEILGGYDAG